MSVAHDAESGTGTCHGARLPESGTHTKNQAEEAGVGVNIVLFDTATAAIGAEQVQQLKHQQHNHQDQDSNDHQHTVDVQQPLNFQ